MDLTEAELGKSYLIREVATQDEEVDSFLFTLGCYSGEPITVISRLRETYVISVRDGRYNIDGNLARSILLQG